jgi:hypothetical protein
MVTAGGNIEYGEEIGGLTGRSQHGGRAAFQGADFGSYVVAGGVCQAGVEITGSFQVKKLAHILRSGVLKSSALYNRYLSRLSIARCITCLDALGIYRIIVHKRISFGK